MHNYNVRAGQTNYSSWSSKYLTNEYNNNWKYQRAVFMHGTHSYYDIGVAMDDCVIVFECLYTKCLRSFRIGYQEKTTETICSWDLMVESIAPC